MNLRALRAILMISSLVSLQNVDVPAPPAQAQVVVGEIIVATGRTLFGVDPSSGMRTIISDFRDAAQGPAAESPMGVAIDASGRILVTDSSAGTGGLGLLLAIDPSTGRRSIITDFGIGENPGRFPSGIAVNAHGDYMVANHDAGADRRGALFRVTPSGGRATVSDFGDPAQGPLGFEPFGVAIDREGAIVVADFGFGPHHRGALFRVDPPTGMRTVITDFNDPSQGPLGERPFGLAIDASGDYVVADADAGNGKRGALFRVTPWGVRTIIHDFGAGGTCPSAPNCGVDSFAVAVDASGDYVVADRTAGTACGRGVGCGALFRVSPSGDRTVITDFGDPEQGATGSYPAGVAIVGVRSATITQATSSASTMAVTTVRSAAEAFATNAASTSGVGVIDAHNDPPLDWVSYEQEASGHVYAQPFTPSLPVVTGVDIGLSAWQQANVTVEIREMVGNSSGAVLASSEQSLPKGYGGYYHFSFSPPATVKPGKGYLIVLKGPPAIPVPPQPHMTRGNLVLFVLIIEKMWKGPYLTYIAANGALIPFQYAAVLQPALMFRTYGLEKLPTSEGASAVLGIPSNTLAYPLAAVVLGGLISLAILLKKRPKA